MSKQIVILGSINYDITASAERLPARGETVAGSSVDMFGGGKGANQAVQSAQMGVPTAMIGQVGNLDRMNVKMGKAGKKRYLGFRPHVRGVAMNPVDHPMGGGEGRTSGGGHPVSPWGQLAKGKRTRNPKKTSKNFIVERRKK